MRNDSILHVHYWTHQKYPESKGAFLSLTPSAFFWVLQNYASLCVSIYLICLFYPFLESLRFRPLSALVWSAVSMDSVINPAFRIKQKNSRGLLLLLSPCEAGRPVGLTVKVGYCALFTIHLTWKKKQPSKIWGKHTEGFRGLFSCSLNRLFLSSSLDSTEFSKKFLGILCSLSSRLSSGMA